MVLGDPGVHADQWHAGAGARDPVQLDGEHLAGRGSPDHEPVGLRCRGTVYELARAAVAQSAAAADRDFQATLRFDAAGLREARDRAARGNRGCTRWWSVDQRKRVGGELHGRAIGSSGEVSVNSAVWRIAI